MSTNEWNFTPPPPSDLGDHDVPLLGTHLQGKRVALLVTGGIAAMKAPLIARALRKYGADVVAFTSEAALRYTTIDTLAWSTNNPVVTRLTAAAEHLSDSAPFDAYLVAPATYNTINKMRYGIADGTITTSLGSALGRMEQKRTAVLVAPTMHGSLHNAILTESMRTLTEMGVRIIPPREDYGKHNIPSEMRLVAEVCRATSRSPLRGVPVLVTGGPTPVPIDSVRRITNKFTGKLGIEIATDLFLRGAEATLVHAASVIRPPDWLPQRLFDTFDDYVAEINTALAARWHLAGIFSAAVADYRPEVVLPGKTPSGGALQTINLVPTPKVIDQVQEQFPDLKLISFKYQEGVSHEALLAIARQRVARGHQAVIANREEERGPAGEQVAYLVTGDGEPRRAVGKPRIAKLIVDYVESLLADRPGERP
jgi:phosphopantothenoylcysteine decarboxylase/phosphopantothenate--cysteine ligase